MLKIGVAALFALIVGILGNPARADKLDSKWTATRSEANALGDRAKAGDKAAAKKLEAFAIVMGNAPAAHNIAWIFQNGYGGAGQSLATACQYYARAVEKHYPPSMHAYANLCLLPRVNSSDGKLEKQAMDMLYDAAKGGWTASAILFAERRMNRRHLSPEGAATAGRAVNAGLQSSPSQPQKVTLAYLQGMTLIYATSPRGSYSLRNFRQGDAALRHADANGHPATKAALKMLHRKWLQALNAHAPGWQKPGQPLAKCVSNIQNAKPNRSLARNCAGTFRVSRARLRRLIGDAKHLMTHLSQKNRNILKSTMIDLGTKSQVFQVELGAWENRFLKRYVERVNTKSWGE